MPEHDEEITSILREMRDMQKAQLEWARELAAKENEERRRFGRQQRFVIVGLLILGAYFVFTQVFDLPLP